MSDYELGVKDWYKFKTHARKRIKERTLMTTREIAVLLDTEKTITIGIEPGSTRIHKLFYSEKDDKHFVLILDDQSKQVITLLPPDYHETISWQISHDTMDQATKLILPPDPILPQPTIVEPEVTFEYESGKEYLTFENIPLDKVPKSCIVRGVYRGSCGIVEEYFWCKIKIHLELSISDSPFLNPSINELKKLKRANTRIMKSKELCVQELRSCVIQFPKSSYRFEVAYQDLGDTENFFDTVV